MAKTTTTKNTAASYSNHKMIFDKIEAWGINNNQKLLFVLLYKILNCIAHIF